MKSDTSKRAPASSASTESDDELLGRARNGDTNAFGELWRRHSGVGKAVARNITATADPDDVVSEAFARILSTMSRGGGPVSGFRPYLITTIRNVARRWAEKPRDSNVENMDELEDEKTLDDPALAALDRSLSLQAFRALPERWQTVLWYSEVEGMDPHEIAPFLGMTANATAALAYRARAGLRVAWIQAHVNDESSSPECRWAIEHLGQFVAKRLSRRDRERVESHLESCNKCPIVVSELDSVGSHLALVLLPLIAGVTVGAGLLASLRIAAHTKTAASPSLQPSQFVNTFGATKVRTSNTLVISGVVAGAIVVGLASTAVVMSMGQSNSAPVAHPAAAATPDAHPSDSATRAPQATATPTPPSVNPTPTPPVNPPPQPQPQPQPQQGTGGRSTKVTTPSTKVTTLSTAVTAPTAATDAPIVLSPASGLLTNSGSPVISGTGTPAATVSIAEGGAVSAVTTVDSSGHWSVAVPLADGVHTLSVAQRIAPKTSSTSIDVTITVDTVAPIAPTILGTIDDYSLLPFTINGHAEPGATVTIYDDLSVLLATVTADSAGSWASGVLTGLSPTVSTLTVYQADAAGNRSVATVTGPIAMQSAIASPTENQQFASGTSVPIMVDGWPGATLQVTLDGAVVTVDGADVVTLDGAGSISLVATWLADGAHSIGFRYVDGGRASTAQAVAHFTIAP